MGEMTGIHQSLLANGALSTKDKTLLLVGLFAARREERHMLYFVDHAVEAGNSVAEMAELIASAIISRGIPSWLSGMEAIQRALELSEKAGPVHSEANATPFVTLEEYLNYYQTEFGALPKWVQYLVDYSPDTFLKYSNLRTSLLRDGEVTRLLKELLLYSINVCDQYGKGIEIHKMNALQLGADEKVLEETKAICIYAVGLKAMWSDVEP
jgi:alkylhydroperoxidase/carboxymuconolactone decarboxylase family protein YurZ